MLFLCLVIFTTAWFLGAAYASGHWPHVPRKQRSIFEIASVWADTHRSAKLVLSSGVIKHTLIKWELPDYGFGNSGKIIEIQGIAEFKSLPYETSMIMDYQVINDIQRPSEMGAVVGTMISGPIYRVLVKREWLLERYSDMPVQHGKIYRLCSWLMPDRLKTLYATGKENHELRRSNRDLKKGSTGLRRSSRPG